MKKLFSFFCGTKRRIVFSSIALVLICATVFSFVILPFLQHGPVVLTCNGLSVREGVVRYLYSFFRYKIPASSDSIQDTDAFWRLIREDGKTNNEYFGEIALDLIWQTVAAARIYDQNATLSLSERQEIDKAISEAVSLSYKGGGSIASFNQKAELYGFNYQDFKTATLLLYKATKLQSALFGDTGSRLADEDLMAYLDAHYSHTMIIFVRTANKFVIDSEGNYVFNTDGTYMTEPLSPEEQEQQKADIAAIEAALANGTNAEEFAQLLQTYNDDADAHQRGGSYYFSEGNAYTVAYGEAYPDVAEAVLSLEKGEWAKASSSVGTHFVFRTEIGSKPYNDKNLDQFFGSDLKRDAMAYLYQKVLKEGVAEVKLVKEGFFDQIDFGAAQPNTALMIAYFNSYTLTINKKS